MKKIIYLFLFILIFAGIVGFIVLQNASLSKENSQSTEKDDSITADMRNVYEIKEKMFIAQINDIYINMNQYEGKTVRFEGLIYNYGENCYVIRRTPGCCGNDGIAGLEVKWDKPYMADDKWVEAIGVIKIEDKISGAEPVVYLTSLTEKEERGADFVTQ